MEATTMSKGGKSVVAARDNIRAIIEERGLSVKAVAEGAGVSQPYLSLMLRGERGLSPDTVDAIAEFLDEPAYLLWRPGAFSAVGA